MNRLEKQNFGLYAVGRLVSLLGSGIQMIAIPLYILQVTGSGTMMGIFTFLNWLPTLGIAPFAGVLGDRWNRKRIMVSMDFARGALILLLSFLAFTDNMSIMILFVCQVFISLMDAIFSSSTQAMIPELVKEDDLMRANSLIGSINSSSMIAGPVLGGIIFGFGGIRLVFLINGISFALSAVSEMFIKYISTTESKERLSVDNVKRDFKEGFSFIRNNRNLLTLIIFFCSVNFLMNPSFAVIVPFAFKEVIRFSDQVYGILEATFMGGILLGNIVLATLLSKKSSKNLIKLGMFGMVVFNIFFTITLFPNSIAYFGGSSLSLVIIISIEFILMGIFNALLNTPINTSFQKMIPNKLRSRVNSVTMVISQAGVPIGAVIYGILLDLMSVHYLYGIVSGLFTILAVGFLLKAPAEVYEFKEAKGNNNESNTTSKINLEVS
ncbi:MFS transporter [Sporosalibacterium faouarense]|uniref:MFS transporter n=1 Tax=Sporosalibacterium faouarense TaxID=516123 RepID=UPI00192A94C3|nr:MFS transporter [Sporosalibacterium faouarense]